MSSQIWKAAVEEGMHLFKGTSKDRVRTNAGTPHGELRRTTVPVTTVPDACRKKFY